MEPANPTSTIEQQPRFIPWEEQFQDHTRKLEEYLQNLLFRGCTLETTIRSSRAVLNHLFDRLQIRRVLLNAGDLLVVEGNGSIDQIGRVALWDGKIAPCAHQNHLIKVRFNQPKLGKYILWWLLSSGGRNFITKIASSTSGLHTLSISKVASLPVPLPSILEQERIVREIERVLSIADVMRQALDIASRQAERLRQSILKQALEGKLVPQDPNDEPAELLLERIKTERAKREAEKQAKAKSNRKPFTKNRTNRTERPAA